MGAFIDLRGRRCGRLVVIEWVDKNKRGNYIWQCLCDCGNVVNVPGGSLQTAKTISCGCLRRELAGNRARTGDNYRTHNRTGTKEYLIWGNMIQRCTNKNHPQFKDWGGRGIIVCERWLHSFENFFEDMGLCPPELTLDRIDNSGNYCKENCRWATWTEQNNNQRPRTKKEV